MARPLLILLLLLPPWANAEILKLAIQNQSGIQFYWWPVLPKIDGWHHDRDYSLEYGSNAQAPDGFDFGNAETVIYARAIFKKRVPEITSLEGFIENDRLYFESQEAVTVDAGRPLVTADGIEMESLVFTPIGEGNWEQVAYGEEGEFYLLFTISSRTQSGFEKSRRAFQAFINAYHR